MLFKLADNTNPASLASRLRAQRLRFFFELLARFPEPVRVLDVGGTSGFWRQNNLELPRKCEITVLNLTPESGNGLPEHIHVVQGDARKMTTIGDQSFEVCFSNSVIEHVGTLYDQMAMAREVRRVARTYFVQTPNRYFPLEPHFLLPGWQWWPVRCRTWLYQRRNLGWMPRTPDPLQAQAEIEQVRLLTARELRLLFPGAQLYREKLGPLTKSLVAWRAES